jgi:hypothetical protein
LLIKLLISSGLGIRIQEEVTIEGLKIFLLEKWNISNNLATTLMKHNSIQEEIYNRLKGGKAFNYSVQNLCLPA